jgi:hypothetical protein
MAFWFNKNYRRVIAELERNLCILHWLDIPIDLVNYDKIW